MSRLVFLLEERSMKVFLDTLLPRIYPGLNFVCIPHEGKQDLEKSIPRKLRAWREPGVGFVVLRDNDNGDCLQLKQHLTTLCRVSGRKETLVRIACQELEAWYLGDPNAMANAFDDENLRSIGEKSLYRQPDAVVNPSEEMKKLVPGFQKNSGARRMAAHMTLGNTQSTSFRTMLEGISRMIKKMAPSGQEKL